MTIKRLAENICTRGEIIYGKARVGGRSVWKRAPYQDTAALNRTGKPNAALLQWRDEWLAGLRVAADKAKTDPDAAPVGRVPAWEELIAAYRIVAPRQFAANGSPAAETVENNVGRLERVLAEIRVSQADPLTAATPEKVEEWVHRLVSGADDAERARNVAARTLAQARSVWARWAWEPYRRRGYVIPRMLERWPRPAGFAPVYQDPAEALKVATRTGAAELEASDPGLWLAYALMRFCGMRPGCAQRARWEWFRPEADGGARLQWAPGKTRQRTRGRMVDQRLSAGFWARLNTARRACGDGDGFVLPGGEAGRAGALERLNACMRAWGWTTPKAGYELRKLFVSEIYNWKGLVWAAAYSGDNPTTIEKYYAAAYRRDAPALDIGGILVG